MGRGDWFRRGVSQRDWLIYASIAGAIGAATGIVTRSSAAEAAGGGGKGGADVPSLPADKNATTVGLGSSFEMKAEGHVVETTTSGNDVFEIDIEFLNRSESESAFQLGYQLLSAQGKPLSDARLTSTAKAARNGDVHWTLTVPDALPDGYYKYRLFGVGSDGKEDTVLDGETAFRVDRGTVVSLTASEWFSVPEVNEATREPLE